MTPICIGKKQYRCKKNTEFDADFESVVKFAQELMQKVIIKKVTEQLSFDFFTD
jgi:hypothetical protein